MKGSRLRRLFSWHAALLLGLMAVCAALTGAHALQQQVVQMRIETRLDDQEARHQLSPEQGMGRSPTIDRP